ncbi:MAG: dihydropteroate synthase [Bacteroidales bacterium]|nr:dihydropteroate synthase [Bacteroidales bacterium]
MMEKTINIRGRLLEIDRPLVMGILNVTDDSFYGGCRVMEEEAVAARVRQIRDEHADILDIGACSTRPGSESVDEATEWERLRRALVIVGREWPEAVVSVDTFRAGVARKCVEAGADIINDVTGGSDPDMFDTVASLHVPYILMHMRGVPATMQSLTDYADVTADVITELAFKVRQLRERGVCDIIIDPGFGFAKTVEQNYEMMSRLDEFVKMDLPVLVGISRKTMIWKPLSITPDDALPGTVALNTFAMLHGADIVRVHDVAAAVQARDVVGMLDIKK